MSYEGLIYTESGEVGYFQKGWIDKPAFAKQASFDSGKSVDVSDVRHEHARWVWCTDDGERRRVLWPAKDGKPGAFKVTLWESWSIAPAAQPPERVCRWTHRRSGLLEPACRTSDRYPLEYKPDADMKYCPYCCGKIEEVRT